MASRPFLPREIDVGSIPLSGEHHHCREVGVDGASAGASAGEAAGEAGVEAAEKIAEEFAGEVAEDEWE